MKRQTRGEKISLSKNVLVLYDGARQINQVSDQQPKKKELQEIKRFDRKKDETEKRLKKNYSSLCTPQIQWSPVEWSQAQEFSNYVVQYRIKRNVRYPKWKHVEVELSKTEKIMTGLAPHRDYLFCISIVSKTAEWVYGARSQVSAPMMVTVNVSFQRGGGGGGEEGWDIQ